MEVAIKCLESVVQAAPEAIVGEDSLDTNKSPDGPESAPDEEGSLGAHLDPPWGDVLFMHSTPPPLSPHRKKRQRQSQRWIGDVIPNLMQQYMDLVAKTGNFQVVSPQVGPACTCGKPSRLLNWA
ncbi:hypothetical protein VNI00_017952 [Paramarasmius palmivorus]|uniref:Uncharacterized protein n=1 Tax=Paramarasmius palmivorus TaxID=297713 RepID=A0AAW0B1G1_9AGAR